MSPSPFLGRVDFVLAHPGHELRLFRWLEILKPTVSLVTCGSRHGDACGRLAASGAVIERAGATRGPLFGAALDRDFYRLVIDGQQAVFDDWVDRLRDDWIVSPPSAVITDSWQLYSVAHDITHLMARVAMAEVSSASGIEIACFDYPVVPDELVETTSGEVVHGLALDDADMARKVDCAHAYPDIAGELAELMKVSGLAALATETLHRPPALDRLAPVTGQMPLFERFGEERKAAGIFPDVLRWSHVAPIFQSLVDRHDRAV